MAGCCTVPWVVSDHVVYLLLLPHCGRYSDGVGGWKYGYEKGYHRIILEGKSPILPSFLDGWLLQQFSCTVHTPLTLLASKQTLASFFYSSSSSDKYAKKRK